MKRLEAVKQYLRIGKESSLLSFLESVKTEPLNTDETAKLADLIASSGQRIDPSRWGSGPVVDVPSTGGLGNKSPIIVPPILASCGVKVPKMSTRGGTAGTIDILESLGYQPDFQVDRFVSIVTESGLSNICQTQELAPLDGKLMSIRRKIGMMEVSSLVVSSILGKKLAIGVKTVVVDVKSGPAGNLGENVTDAIAASKMLVEVGKKVAIRVACVISDNSFPQGEYLGARPSMIEVAEVLKGCGPDNQRDVCMILSAVALCLSGAVDDVVEGFRFAKQKVLDPFAAMEKLREQLKNHNAETKWMNDPSTLLEGFEQVAVRAERKGFVSAIDAIKIKKILKKLIVRRDGSKDLDAGMRICKSIGESVEAGEDIAYILCKRKEQRIESMRKDLLDCFQIALSPVERPPSVLAIVDETGQSIPRVQGDDLVLISGEEAVLSA